LEGDRAWGGDPLMSLPVFGIGPRVAILACLSESLALRGYPPSGRELMDAAGLRSFSSVHHHLKRLRAEGYVTWNDGEQRTLRFAGEEQR
jgi:SOS-response transcriptional repressor LexA